MRDYDNHCCIGSLDAHCFIRRYPDMRPAQSVFDRRDGYWHLYQEDYKTGFLCHVTRIRYCPWCGEEL